MTAVLISATIPLEQDRMLRYQFISDILHDEEIRTKRDRCFKRFGRDDSACDKRAAYHWLWCCLA